MLGLIVVLLIGFMWFAVKDIDISSMTQEDILGVLGRVLLVFLCIGVMYCALRRKNQKVIRWVERQENYLHVDFNKDMQGICMQGGLRRGVEIIAHGDWFVALSESRRTCRKIYKLYAVGDRIVDRRANSYGLQNGKCIQSGRRFLRMAGSRYRSPEGDSQRLSLRLIHRR